jgi:hypothetical protein
MKNKIIAGLFILIFAMTGYSQTGDTSKVRIRSTKPVISASGVFPTSSIKLMKNSPFSAEGVSESVQVLQDGNRITKNTTVKMFRDSEGRFRREGSGSTGSGIAGFNVWALRSFSGSSNSVYIYDPVESVRYTLNLDKKTARRYKSSGYSETYFITEKLPKVKGITVTPEKKAEFLKKEVELKARMENTVIVGSLVGVIKRDSKTEDLGTKFFEGVEAEGTKTTVTIEAGAIGNERPIETVYEKWYSKELGMIVYSRNYDPRYGEQTYRLININRSEPDSTLFTVPADFEILKNNKGTLTYIAKPKK